MAKKKAGIKVKIKAKLRKWFYGIKSGLRNRFYRKRTTPLHYLVGVLIPIYYLAFPELAIFLGASFGFFELFQWHRIKDTGPEDFHEFLASAIITTGVLFIWVLT